MAHQSCRSKGSGPGLSQENTSISTRAFNRLESCGRVIIPLRDWDGDGQLRQHSFEKGDEYGYDRRLTRSRCTNRHNIAALLSILVTMGPTISGFVKSLISSTKWRHVSGSR